MRKLMVVIALAGLILSSCGAKLIVRGTVPAQLNGGTCAAPILSPAPSSWATVVHIGWTGPEAGEDSLASLPGQAFEFTRTVRPGTYTVRAWASNAYGFLAACDTSLTATAGDPPAKVQLR